MPESLLHLKISADYPRTPGVLRELTLDVHAGEILGLVGRSGEGKSTITMAILGMLGHKGGRCQGQIVFQGRDLLKLTEREMRKVRGKEIGLVPQSPLSSLNPQLRLGAHLEEARRAHDGDKAAWAFDATHPSTHPGATHPWGKLMESVSLPTDAAFLRRYPRDLSVGMAQRFLIGMAILHRPPLLLADEPTSALDMITQAEILQLFAQVNRERGIAMLYISHDLASVASLCHRVAILLKGQIVECGATLDVFQNPQHEYTKRLIAAIPAIPLSPDRQNSLAAMSKALGEPVSPDQVEPNAEPNIDRVSVELKAQNR